MSSVHLYASQLMAYCWLALNCTKPLEFSKYLHTVGTYHRINIEGRLWTCEQGRIKALGGPSQRIPSHPPWRWGSRTSQIFLGILYCCRRQTSFRALQIAGINFEYSTFILTFYLCELNAFFFLINWRGLCLQITQLILLLYIALISMLAASYNEKITHSIENCSLIDSNNKFMTIN